MNRVNWIDAARGIGIVLVVLGHVERGLVGSGIARSAGWLDLDFVLYSFHMPLFFLLAGLNAPRGLSRGSKHYLLSKVTTVVYPYFLWSIIQGLTLVSMSSLTNGKYNIDDLLQIGWTPMSQFWFLYTLMMIHITVSIIGNRILPLIIVGVVSFVASQFYPLNSVLERYFHCLPFFALGIALFRFIGAVDELRPVRLPYVAALWLTFGVSVYASWAFDSVNFDRWSNLPAALCGIAAVIATAKWMRERTLKGFVYLGVASMTIYVMHILAAAGLRILMSKLRIPPMDLLYAAACTAIGLGAPLLAHTLLSRFGLLPLLGLAAPAKRSPRVETPVGQAAT
jgi:fucose 4-O-acetylase-like acetyltransferase